ncbi:hypothetical protein CDD81_5889 [Ophiocordyceps australis]|uniref:DNA mismatch repair proteins mutS family domain-containing protein n=1 Tax=Ophiocordyceps australis TaxID=1399860 RepID=A0A2C5YDG7_9HYPO|nr:hypothetical protein CDD81_5889 [Ophiocordyceps australis]
MMIDISAIQSLEIMQNLRDHKSKDSLYGLLNYTSTPMGARMLRNNILQPPTRSEAFIAPRYDALEELSSREETFHEIRKSLKLFHDVERVLTRLIIVRANTGVDLIEEQIGHILLVKSFLEAVTELHKALRPVQSTLLVKIRDLCRPEITRPVLSNIKTVIEADVTYVKSPLDLRNQRTFAVKPGISGMLDVARQTYKELTEEVHEHIDDINKRFQVCAILKYDSGRKYWLRIRVSDFENAMVPPLFINQVRKKDVVECQTLNLVKLNVRLSDTSNEVVIRSDVIIQNLLQDLRAASPQLFRVCESVALVDMLTSFAQLTTTCGYVRPELTDTLALKAARHPILDIRLSGGFVPNDYYATDQYCFHVVTGCNMSGKSTYIRAVALLQIMAQVGCFVPAEYAAFPVVNNIFARVSMEDSIEASLSTFSVEMREMAFILRNVDGKSLAIIDELGRGTSTRDGLSIAIAISEALVQTKASVCYNDEHHYGIHLARAIGVPADQARNWGSKESLPGYLKRLQSEFVARMTNIDDD